MTNLKQREPKHQKPITNTNIKTFNKKQTNYKNQNNHHTTKQCTIHQQFINPAITINPTAIKTAKCKQSIQQTTPLEASCKHHKTAISNPAAKKQSEQNHKNPQ